ncbi:MAG: hypothetical protein HeimC3_30930 [Candidatus Heimdallarchaeota archaeon LC_3]|nr:MAG: hypothetical protein HeimC3_30930 [Candidatus Heimdallarchaeota archaeon LC_3]
MAISTPKLIGITGALAGALIITAFILFNSLIPQYSVYEMFEKNNPNDLIGKNVQLVGDVYNITNENFLIRDWEGMNYSVIVQYENVPIPSGFETGKRVLVEGTIDVSPEGWVIKATQISTKCPSKYQN